MGGNLPRASKHLARLQRAWKTAFLPVVYEAAAANIMFASGDVTPKIPGWTRAGPRIESACRSSN